MSEQSNVEARSPGTDPPPPPPPTGHGRRLYRRMDTKMIGGVAAGIADYFDVDPTLVRIAFVVAAFLGGAGIVAYGVGWILLPPTYEDPSPGESFVRRLKAAPSWFAIALLAVGVVLLIQASGLVNPPVGWGIVLVVLGILLFRHASMREEDGPLGPPPPPTAGGFPGPAVPPPPPAPSAFERIGGGVAAPPAPPGAPAPPAPPPAWPPPAGQWPAQPPPTRVPRVRRPKDRWLWWFTLGAAFLAVGVAALLDNAGVVDVGARGYMALALAVLGLGLVVGSWWGRSRGLIVLAVLLTPVVLVASLVNVPFRGGVGDRFFDPRTVSAVRPEYRQVAGRMVIDLSAIEVGTAPLTVTASMVAGSIEVVLPRGVHASVHAKAGAGELQILGNHAEGLNVDTDRTTGPVDGGNLDLDVQVSFGRVLVYRSQGG